MLFLNGWSYHTGEGKWQAEVTQFTVLNPSNANLLLEALEVSQSFWLLIHDESSEMLLLTSGKELAAAVRGQIILVARGIFLSFIWTANSCYNQCGSAHVNQSNQDRLQVWTPMQVILIYGKLALKPIKMNHQGTRKDDLFPVEKSHLAFTFLDHLI